MGVAVILNMITRKFLFVKVTFIDVNEERIEHAGMFIDQFKNEERRLFQGRK